MTRLPAASVFDDRALVAAVAVGVAAVVEYATTGTVGTGTFAVVVVVTFVANAMRERRRESAPEAERSTEERENAVAPAQEVKEHGTEYDRKNRGKA